MDNSKQRATSLRYVANGAPPNGVATINSKSKSDLAATRSSSTKISFLKTRNTGGANYERRTDNEQGREAGYRQGPRHVRGICKRRRPGIRRDFYKHRRKKPLCELARPIDELRHTIGKALSAAIELRQNYIIRPRSTFAKLIQLDDLDSAKTDRIAPHTFMTLETSPGNFQAWLAMSDVPADKNAMRDLARRIRKGAGADPTASGATRISGSLNFKTKYAPEFPLVELRQVEAGRVRHRQR